MACLASLASLGSTGINSSAHLDESPSSIRRIFFSKGTLGCRCRWRCVSSFQCRYSVTEIDPIADQGSAAPLDPKFRGNNDAVTGFVLKAAPKPVVNSVNLAPPDTLKLNSWLSPREKLVNEKQSEVIESLGEVLEKAEKLQTSGFSRPVSKGQSESVNKQTKISPPYNKRSIKSTNSSPGVNTSKSVWRRGNPVSTMPPVVKDSSRTIIKKVEKENPKNVQTIEKPTNEQMVQKVESKPRVPIRPTQPPLNPQPKLLIKPSSVVPPPSPQVKKPIILKNVGLSSKPQVVINGAETISVVKPKDKKPILVDKFGPKRPEVDPMAPGVVTAPTKPAKGTGPSKGTITTKFKDDFRRKGAPSGLRRHLIKDDVDIPDDEASEFNVSIPGAAKKSRKGGKKWTKARRKAVRLQAEKDAAPVKVEILEVGERGMLMEDLAYNLAISEGEILGLLYSKGIKPDGVQTLDKEIVKMVCSEYEVEVIDAATVKVEEMAKKKKNIDEDALEKLQVRPPVLTIMGHVDHGKTTLLDYIRKSKVAASEAGGITQGIGAYKVLVPMDGKLQPCVFLDTPGHAAFGAMRARGARVTDIAIIVVAADDGVRPQTHEAIAHARAAGVPIIIAINKIDVNGANPQRVMQELSSIGLMSEDWGGDIPMIQVSALKGEKVDDLLETVMLVAEMLELKANPNRHANGTVIEACLHKSKGPVATFIIQNGTLKQGDIIVCGESFGKVRALFDDLGSRVDEAGPSLPVQVTGLNNVPKAGDEFEVVDSLDFAREKADLCKELIRNERISAKAGDGMVTLSSLASAVSAGRQSGLDLHQLNIILKVDVQGSIEAIRQALQALPQVNVTLKFLLEAAGDVNSSDVDLAVASKAIILGFNIKIPASVKTYSESRCVEIRLYKVIYELIDDVRNAMEGMLDLVEEHLPLGKAAVRATFSSGSGRVAGCMITEGKFVKGCGIRVLRNRKAVQVGVLDSLRRVKENVKEVNMGLECGIGMNDYDDWETGDVVEAFEKVQKKRTLEEASAAMTAAFEGVGIQN